MKTENEIRRRLLEMDEAEYHQLLLKKFGSIPIPSIYSYTFDEVFLHGFMDGLRNVFSKSLDTEGIKSEYYYIKDMHDKQTKHDIGERNAYAWCLNWKTK